VTLGASFHWSVPSQPPVACWSPAERKCSKAGTKYGFVAGKKWFQLCFVRNSPRWTSRRLCHSQNENPVRGRWAGSREPSCTAGAFGFFILSQSGERPER